MSDTQDALRDLVQLAARGSITSADDIKREHAISVLRAALASSPAEGAERLCARCFISPTTRTVPLCEVCEPKMLDEWGPPQEPASQAEPEVRQGVGVLVSKHNRPALDIEAAQPEPRGGKVEREIEQMEDAARRQRDREADSVYEEKLKHGYAVGLLESHARALRAALSAQQETQPVPTDTEKPA